MRARWNGGHFGFALLLIFLIAVCSGCTGDRWRQRHSTEPTWNERLAVELPRMGHRNWIVVADSAYPAQSRTGIETIATGAGQIETVKAVLDAIDRATHVRAKVTLDHELAFVDPADAPGIAAYREALDRLLEGRPVTTANHEETIAKLDEAARTFNVLILKTDMTLPYTSVFIELDCGYWSGDAEKRLREAVDA